MSVQSNGGFGGLAEACAARQVRYGSVQDMTKTKGRHEERVPGEGLTLLHFVTDNLQVQRSMEIGRLPLQDIEPGGSQVHCLPVVIADSFHRTNSDSFGFLPSNFARLDGNARTATQQRLRRQTRHG